MADDYLIWDFNGTVFDDVTASRCAVNVLLARRQLAVLPDDEAYRRVFDFPVENYYAAIGVDFRKEDFHAVAVEWMTQYEHFSRESGLVAGVKDVLDAAKAAGKRQIILSATEKCLLAGQLDRLGVSTYFDEVLARDDIHAAGKTALGLAWKERAKPGDLIMIGDTLHDLESANALGAQCILFAGGHTDARRLAASGAPQANTMADVRRLLCL